MSLCEERSHPRPADVTVFLPQTFHVSSVEAGPEIFDCFTPNSEVVLPMLVRQAYTCSEPQPSSQVLG